MTEFSRQFQKQLLASLVQDLEGLTGITGILKPEHFEDATCGMVYSAIRSVFKQYGLKPTRHALRAEIENTYKGEERKVCIKLLNTLFKPLSKVDKDHIILLGGSYARRQNVVNAVTEGIDHLKSGQLDRFVSSVNKANAQLAQAKVHTLSESLPEVTKPIEDRIIFRTGIAGVDSQLTGHGLAAKELLLIIGDTGDGKSMLMITIGRSAALQGKKVLYVTVADISWVDVMQRFLAGLATMEIDLLSIAKTLKLKEAIKRVQRQGQDLFHCVEYPAGTVGVSQIEALLTQLSADGKPVEVLIVDYADELASSQATDAFGRYAELGSIFSELKAIAQQREIVVITASQPGSVPSDWKGLGEGLLTVRNTAESKRKGRISDVVITINISPAEAQKDRARLFFSKNRRGKRGAVIAVETRFERGSFCKMMIEKRKSKKKTKYRYKKTKK